MPYEIAQCYLPAGRGDILALVFVPFPVHSLCQTRLMSLAYMLPACQGAKSDH